MRAKQLRIFVLKHKYLVKNSLPLKSPLLW